METKFQTSFIPKKPLLPSTGPSYAKYYTGNIISIIGIAIFVIATLVYLALFGYSKYVEGQIKTMDQKLSATRSQFNESTLAQFDSLDKKIRTAKMIVSTHVAPSLFFNLLQSVTVEGVRFNDLNYATGADGSITVMGHGEARSYAALALQADTLNKNSSFKNPQFLNFDLNDKGNVVFDFTTGIDRQSVLFVNTISATSTATST